MINKHGGLEDYEEGDDRNVDSDPDVGESVGSDIDGGKSIDNNTDEGGNNDTGGSEDGNSDTEEEETSDSKSVDTEEKEISDSKSVDTEVGTQDSEHEYNEVVEEEGDTRKNFPKERFFYFIFEVEDFFDSEDMEKLEENVARWKEEEKADNSIDEDESDIPQNNDEVIQDVEVVRESFKENGRECFKSCSKRKLKSVRNMCRVLVDAENRMILKKFNPAKYQDMRKSLKPYNKSIKKLTNPYSCTHERRKILQKSQVGAKILDAAVGLLIPAMKARKKGCIKSF